MANELSKTEIKEIKISQNKIDEFSDEITNASELIENSMRVIKNVALSEHTINGDFEEWKKKQKIVRINLRKELTKSVKNSQILIKKTIQNTMSNVGDIVEDMTEETKKKVKPKKTFTPKLISKVEKGIKILGNKMLSDYDKTVANVYKLRNQEPLFESILKETQTGIDKAPTKIYADGKEFSFKSYMEMNVRTTVRHEANELLFNASKMNGVVFYICSHFGDCAKDHADYQGKYYYDEDWESFGYNEQISKQISSYIKSNNLQSYQEVVYKEPFLTTRPNCRHSFRPVVLTDIIEEAKSANQMLGEYKLIKNTYNDKNYIDLQTQRKNERAIRFYKTRLEENKLMLEKNPTDQKLIALIKKDRALIKKWQTKQDDLLDSNPILKRDKRRENNKVLVQDLGAGYQLGLKIDGKNMYVKEAIKEPLTVKDIAPSGKVEVKKEKNYITEKELEIFDSIRDKKRENLIVYDDNGKIVHKEGGKSKGHTGYEEFDYKGLNAVHNHPEGYGYYPSKTDLVNLHLTQAKSITIVSKEHTIKIIRTNKVYQDSYILQDIGNMQNEMRNLEKREIPSPFGNMSADQYRRKNNATIKETNDLKAEHQLKLIKKLMENEGYIVIIK